MKEITDKLAGELLEHLNDLERFCDDKVRHSTNVFKKSDPDWMSASQMCHNLRSHLYYHMQDMIEHPDAANDELPEITVIDFKHINEGLPQPSCDINDLLLWCPDHGMGNELVLGNYDGDTFTAHFELDDDFNDVMRKDLNVSHWAPAPHNGPEPKYGIWMLRAYVDTNKMVPATSNIKECIGCGCNDMKACIDKDSGQACYWLRVDEKEGIGVCSSCRDHLDRWDAGKRDFLVQAERN